MTLSEKRVAFLINSMALGGAERLVQRLLQGFRHERGLEVQLLLLEDERLLELPSGIAVTALAKRRRKDCGKALGLFSGAWKLRRIVQQQQLSVVVSFLERANFVNILARMLGGEHWVVISEHTNPERNYRIPAFRNALSRMLLRALYHRADRIIAVSSGVKDALVDTFGVAEQSVEVVHDACDTEEIERLAEEPVEHPWFAEPVPVVVTAGRLVEAKGHTHLLRAFARVRNMVRCRLLLLGDGEERGRLEQLAAHLGLSEEVAFLGWQENPYKYMARSTVFVFPSLWEGFGMALIEALACQLPIVSYDCESGPSEILGGGRYGILVPVGDEAGLAEAILRLLQDADLRRSFAAKARQRAREFSIDQVVQRYMTCWDASL